MADPLYYALEPGPKNGRLGTVWKRPVETEHEDRTSVTMGFKVCDCNEFVPGAATAIADALNRLPELEAALRLVKQTLTIPAAEYVPAIPDAWAIIDKALGNHA